LGIVVAAVALLAAARMQRWLEYREARSLQAPSEP
jgi:hypothetical protein